MLDSEKFAIAAHLHVLLRRKVGRVTDVEWMVRNREYALEVIRVSRAEPHVDIHEWADKLEAALAGTSVPQPKPSSAATRSVLNTLDAVLSSSTTPSTAPDSTFGAPVGPLATPRGGRYVGRLR